MKKFVGLSVLIFSFFVLSSNFSKAEVMSESSFVTKLESLPQGEFQFSKSFPTDYSSSLINNNSATFKSFQGQGVIYLTVSNVESFKLYINDSLVPTDLFSQDGVYELDVSEILKDGNNSVLVLNSLPKDSLKDSFIKMDIPYSTVIESNYKNKIINQEMMLLLDQIVNAETQFGLTGVQISVIKDGNLQKSSSYGYLNNYKNVFDKDGYSILDNIDILPVEERIKVNNNTLFDMASNTKMYTTVFALQKLMTDGKISLEDKVSSFFPKFVDDGVGIQGKSNVTVGHLLRHDAGFTPDPQYHNENYLDLDFDNTGKNPYFSQNRDLTLDMVLKTPLQSKPGSKVLYSDVDFILLGFIVEKITGERLDEYAKSNFYDSLNLTNTMFNPLEHGVSTNQVTASELHGNSRDGRVNFTNNRDEVIQGTVHDEKAYYSLDGVSGHAGLFSTTNDIAKLAQLMLSDGGNGTQAFFSSSTIDRFVSPSLLNDTYSYGWRRQGNQNYSSIYSTFASNQTIGHTGWTGTLSLIDPKQNLVIVMNSNSRNSSIMGPGQNTFYTSSFLTNGYGTVSSLVFQSLNKGSTSKSDELLIDLINQKSALVFNGNQNHTSGRNSFRALLSVLETRSVYSEMCQHYLASKKVSEWKKTLSKQEENDYKQLAFSKAVDFSIMDNYFDVASRLSSIYYSDISWKNLENSILEAKNLKESLGVSQVDVDKSTKKIVEAIDLLELKQREEESVDKTNLEKAIKEAKSIDQSIFTSESLSVLNTSLKSAEKVYNDQKSKQIDIDKAETVLLNAIEMLEEKALEIKLSTRALEVIKNGSTLKVSSQNYNMNDLNCKIGNEQLVELGADGQLYAKKVGITKVTYYTDSGIEESFTLRISK